MYLDGYLFFVILPGNFELSERIWCYLKEIMSSIAKLDRNMQIAQAAVDLKWRNIEKWGVEGKGWKQTESYFDRLPAAAKKVVRPPVWELSLMTAGMATRFQTNAGQISVRYKLRFPTLASHHMAATGYSGADLYGRNARGQWQWVGIARPNKQEVETQIVGGLDGQMREYMLYLPLYNGVTAFEIGVPPRARFTGLSPRTAKPLVFYGTSILQGGCASRPGMVWPSILGRWFDRPVINLGFSGNGRMDLELASLMAKLDARIYVLDCLPNMNADSVRERAEKFIKILRRASRGAPIVLVEDRTRSNAPFAPKAFQTQTESRQALHRVFSKLVAGGMQDLYYVTGDHLFGDDYEGTVDSSHATDLGFFRQAQAIKPVLENILCGLPE